MRIGVISDTHGRMHERVLELFAGVGQILHAGDVGSDDVLSLLESVAPVIAVRGNTDHYPGAFKLPGEVRIERGGLRIVMVHDAASWLAAHGEATLAEVDVLVSGHTHLPTAERFNGCLRLNPGSASTPGHARVPTVALLEAIDGRPQATIVPLWPEGREQGKAEDGRGGRI